METVLLLGLLGLARRKSALLMILVALILCPLAGSPLCGQEAGRPKMKGRLGEDLVGTWLLNDVKGALAQARQTRKPVMVVFR
jgi:hypothetical protein